MYLRLKLKAIWIRNLSDRHTNNMLVYVLMAFKNNLLIK